MKSSKTVSNIGILGGGQLGRMLAMAAKKMAYHVTVLDPLPHCPGGQISDKQIVASFDNQAAIRELVESCDVTTFEIESIETAGLIELEAQGHAIFPSPRLLATLQDKLIQKQHLHDANLSTAEFVDASEPDFAAFTDFGFPLVQKARRGGYDGRGVAIIKSASDFEKHLPVPSYIERFVPAKKELSVLVARDKHGNSRCYPVVEMIVDNAHNVLDSLITPARISATLAKQAELIASKAIDSLEGVGLFGVELFLTHDDEILINEIAPRTHNSGHHTIEACVTDQFEQHLRAVIGLPLGSPEQISPAVMINLLGAENAKGKTKVLGLAEALAKDGVSVHLYGKANASPYRKMGHLTILKPSIEKAIAAGKVVRELITITGEDEHA